MGLNEREFPRPEPLSPVDRARRELDCESIFEEMGQVHHQADLVQIFAEIGDWRGIKRQLAFLARCVERAGTTVIEAEKGEGAAQTSDQEAGR